MLAAAPHAQAPSCGHCMAWTAPQQRLPAELERQARSAAAEEERLAQEHRLERLRQQVNAPRPRCCHSGGRGPLSCLVLLPWPTTTTLPWPLNGCAA